MSPKDSTGIDTGIDPIPVQEDGSKESKHQFQGSATETPKFMNVETQGQGQDRVSSVKGLLREGVELVVVTLFLLIVIRLCIGEARYIPSASMEPTLQINDRLIVEKITKNTGHKIQRGDILVFYPPPIETGGVDLKNDPLSLLGRWTGLPFLPNDMAFIKRVVGMEGDHIRIQANDGVFINGQRLDESDYIKEKPNYDLNVLGDIGGRNLVGEFIHPYDKRPNDPIMVPAGHLFMMGDNRNNSEDSHVWGFLDEKRVIGKAWVLIWRRLNTPSYPPVLSE